MRISDQHKVQRVKKRAGGEERALKGSQDQVGAHGCWALLLRYSGAYPG